MSETPQTPKILRIFEAGLSKEESTRYMSTSKIVVSRLRQMPDWNNRLVNAYMIGSVPQNKAKTGSDMDLLFVLNIILTDKAYWAPILQNNINSILANIGMSDVPIKIQILLKSWLENPESLSDRDKKIVISFNQDIKNGKAIEI